MKNIDYAMVQDPYVSIDGLFTFFTFTDYTNLSQIESVVAVDLNLDQSSYQDTITKYLSE